MSFWKKLFGGKESPMRSAQKTGNGELDSKLIEAISERKVADVKALLDAGANPNAESRRSPYRPGSAAAIHFALVGQYAKDEEEELSWQIIDLLLKRGANIDAPGSDGYGDKPGLFTPLMNAVQNERARTVEWLIQHGAKTNARTSDGRTAFRLCMDDERDAGHKDHWEVLRVLGKYAEDGKAWFKSSEGQQWTADHTEDPTAPLGVSPAGAWSDLQDALSTLESSSPKQEEIIRWVESGGNVNWTCAAGMTLLHYAAMRDNERMVRFLLEHCANVNALAKSKMTPLLWACANISTSVIPTLLDHGADPRAKTEDGYTALRFLRQSGLEEAKRMQNLILSKGVETTFGKDATCPECGAPETMEMRKRGVQVTLDGIFVEFPCLNCAKKQQISLESIDKSRGIQVQCSLCGAIAFVPSSVWCKTCGEGLSTGWQSSLAKSVRPKSTSKDPLDTSCIKCGKQIGPGGMRGGWAGSGDDLVGLMEARAIYACKSCASPFCMGCMAKIKETPCPVCNKPLGW